MAGELLEAFPLTWPERQRRTAPNARRHGQFKTSLGRSRDELLEELRRLGTRHIVISSNVPVRRDGLPYADARDPVDPGVAVYFDRYADGKWSPFVIACDAYTKVRANLRAISATVEALRAIERHGSSSMLDQAFTGFAALPPASGVVTSEPSCWAVLGLPVGASRETIRERVRSLARAHHPDVGGSSEAMARINAAADQALREAAG